MNTTSAIRTIIRNIRANTVTYLEGPPGIGKSSLPIQAAKLIGADCLVLPPAPTIEPVDLRGAMKVVTPEDAKNFSLSFDKVGSTLAFPPDFLPRSVTKTTIIVIDDVPTGLPSVQAALFQLLLDRKLGSYNVPDGVHFVLTGNRLEDKAGASRTLTALDSRVNRICVDVSFNDWINWAVKNDIAPEVIAFHRFNAGKYLWQFDATKKVNPLPRTWEFLSNKVKVLQKEIADAVAAGETPPSESSSEVIEWFQGDVGQEAANLFVGFTKVFKDLPDPASCIANPTGAKVPTDIGAVLCLTTALSRIVTSATLPKLITYLGRLAKEYEVLCVQDAINQNKALKETSAYTKWAVANKTVLLGQAAA